MSRGRRRGPSGEAFQASEPARKAAAAVLQVMAGLKTPAEASEGIGVSVNRYYQLESRALSGMVKALEPLPRGRRRRPEAEMERLQHESARWEREASRYMALWRAGQRALGLAPPIAKAGDSKGPVTPGKKARRPRVRAKALITALSAAEPPKEAATAAVGASP